jgi:hypothetical protein
MTNTILTHYDINPDTLALLPARHTDYDTIVWEKDQVLYVKQPVLDLIKKGCLNGGAKFDGRKASVSMLFRPTHQRIKTAPGLFTSTSRIINLIKKRRIVQCLSLKTIKSYC